MLKKLFVLLALLVSCDGAIAANIVGHRAHR